MDTLQMYEIVNRLPHLKPHFQGIFATDTLPDQVTRFPSAIVCNTDPAENRVHTGLPSGSKIDTNVNFTIVLVDDPKNMETH